MTITKRIHTETTRQTIQHLFADEQSRGFALRALEQSLPKRGDAESTRVSLLLMLNRELLLRCIDKIEEGGGYHYDETNSDSARAHRKVAALQDLLEYLGYYLGPAPKRSAGYYGGPPGQPVRIARQALDRVRRRRSRTTKLLAGTRGVYESWTRDAVRRLQVFLGNQHLGSYFDDPKGCLARPDGLFGSRTLAALKKML